MTDNLAFMRIVVLTAADLNTPYTDQREMY